MSAIRILFAAVALHTGNAVRSKASTEPVVHTLTSHSWEGFMEREQLVLLVFCQAGHPFCDAFRPDFAKAAKKLADEPIVLARYDCSGGEDDTICASHAVKPQMMPRLVVYQHGSHGARCTDCLSPPAAPTPHPCASCSVCRTCSLAPRTRCV